MSSSVDLFSEVLTIFVSSGGLMTGVVFVEAKKIDVF